MARKLVLSAAFVAVATLGIALPVPADRADFGGPHHFLYTDDQYDARAGRFGLALSTQNMALHGGPIMPTVSAYAIYWLPGGMGASSTYRALTSRYFQDVGGSSFYSLLGQYYGVDGQYVENSVRLAGTWLDTTTPYGPRYHTVPGVSYDFVPDFAIRQEIESAIAVNGWPNGGLNVMFFVFTGVSVESCTINSFLFCDPQAGATPNIGRDLGLARVCGYHSVFGDPPIVYAFMPYGATWRDYCGAQINAYPNDADSDIEISILSHEHFEGVTDPLLGTGWTDSDGGSGEIGDKCVLRYGSRRADGANVILNGHPYVVQEEWSNAAFNGAPYSGCTLPPIAGSTTSTPTTSTTLGPRACHRSCKADRNACIQGCAVGVRRARRLGFRPEPGVTFRDVKRACGGRCQMLFAKCGASTGCHPPTLPPTTTTTTLSLPFCERNCPAQAACITCGSEYVTCDGNTPKCTSTCDRPDCAGPCAFVGGCCLEGGNVTCDDPLVGCRCPGR